MSATIKLGTLVVDADVYAEWQRVNRARAAGAPIITIESLIGNVPARRAQDAAQAVDEAKAQVRQGDRPTSQERAARDAGITRLERVDTAFMEPHLAGDSLHYVETTEEGYLYRCDECGLVWEKKWHARECAGRGHKTSFEQGPYGRCWIENGRMMGSPVYYTRRAVRRDPVAK